MSVFCFSSPHFSHCHVSENMISDVCSFLELYFLSYVDSAVYSISVTFVFVKSSHVSLWHWECHVYGLLVSFGASTRVCYSLTPLRLVWCTPFISTSKLFLIFPYSSDSPSLSSIWARHLFIPQDDGWFPLKMTLITAQLSFLTPHPHPPHTPHTHTQFKMLHVKAILEQQCCQTTSKVNSWAIITTSINLGGCGYWKIYLGPVRWVSYYSCIIRLSLMKYFIVWMFLIQMISRGVC